MTLWKGRFSKDTDDLVTRLSESISFDRRLYAQDIRGSIAHVRMLGTTGIIPQDDATAIIRELDAIKAEIDSGDFEFNTRYEDIHMNIESRLIDRLGAVGARVHTARSRNDQIATDMRLYLRDEIDDIDRLIANLQRELVGVAQQNQSFIMPGFTHLQHAQPVLVAHHLLAYVEMFERDRGRLRDCRARMNICPLGSGALAGATLPIDRRQTGSVLGFEDITRNSMDAVADRDFIIEFLGLSSILMMHLSRISEDIVFWMSPECRFVDLDDGFCTGSSLMPQKKNPDVAELARGKSGRVFGNLMSLLTVMKGLPLCYNRDMQEDKEPLFDTIDTVKLILAVYAPMIAGMRFNPERLTVAVSDPTLMATDLAEWLVTRNVPFREAHEKVGKLVAYSQQHGEPLDEIELSEMRTIIPEATEECRSLFSAERSVNARDIFGATSPRGIKRRSSMKWVIRWRRL